jgi:hypothetical protein
MEQFVGTLVVSIIVAIVTVQLSLRRFYTTISDSPSKNSPRAAMWGEPPPSGGPLPVAASPVLSVGSSSCCRSANSPSGPDLSHPVVLEVVARRVIGHGIAGAEDAGNLGGGELVEEAATHRANIKSGAASGSSRP